MCCGDGADQIRGFILYKRYAVQLDSNEITLEGNIDTLSYCVRFARGPVDSIDLPPNPQSSSY